MRMDKKDITIGKTIIIKIPDEISDRLDWNNEDIFWCHIEDDAGFEHLVIGRVVRSRDEIGKAIKSIRSDDDDDM